MSICFADNLNCGLFLYGEASRRAELMKCAAFSGWCLTSKLTGPEQWDGICASVFASANTGTLCRVRLSDLLGVDIYVLLLSRVNLAGNMQSFLPTKETESSLTSWRMLAKVRGNSENDLSCSQTTWSESVIPSINE